MSYSNGNTYKGYWKKNRRHGKGVFKSKTTGKFDGDFKDDINEGFGVWYKLNGDIYSGEWKDGQMHGRGVINYIDGSQFEGEFKHGMRDGYGIDITSTGEKIKGQWKQGKSNGKFLLENADGKWEQTFIDGEPEGNGVFTFKNGLKWEGKFQNDEYQAATFPNLFEWIGSKIDSYFQGNHLKAN